MNLQDIFGPSATLVGGTLTADITEMYLLDDPAANVAQIVASAVLGWKNKQPANASEDATLGVVVGDPFTSISRNDTQLERQYGVSIYTPITIGAIDPDDVI